MPNWASSMISIDRSEFIELECKSSNVSRFLAHKLYLSVLTWSIGLSAVYSLGCTATKTDESTPQEKTVTAGDATMLSSFDYSTALVTHGVSFALDGIDSKILSTAQKAGSFACEMAQRSEELTRQSSTDSVEAELIHSIQRQGADPHLGLEIARVVASCYATSQGHTKPDAYARALFLSLASTCFSQQETSSDAMNRLMLALFDSQEMPLATYVDSLSKARSELVFSRHFVQGSRICSHLSERGPEQLTASRLESVDTETEAEPQRVYVGILRGQAPGRVRLVVRERVIGGEVTIGGKKLSIQGKVGRFNTLQATGTLGTELIELRGKLKDRARKIRGRYDGKIRRRNQPRRSRLIGFWEATLDEESPK